MKKSIELIAEIAQGFEGNETLARLLLKAAILSDADAAKFQLVYADELATPDYPYYGLFKALEMEQSIWSELCDTAHSSGKKVYFDIFGPDSLAMAIKVGADGVKLSTTEFYNSRLFDSAISAFETVFVSVGGIPVEDMDRKLLDLDPLTKAKICLMYGLQAEPTPLNENNLIKLQLLKKRYSSFKIGFMDHSDGGRDDAFYLPLIAMGVGVDAIEKHITLDRELEIEDFVSGLTPTDFTKFVEIVRRFEPVFGRSTLDLSSQEEAYRAKAGKSVVALRSLKAGQVIEEADIALKRSSIPISDVSILEIEMALGKVLNSDVEIHQPLSKELL